jgi:hypothetical protein
VGGKIKGEAVEAGPGRESGVRGVGAEIVEGELSVGKKFVPEVGGKVRMARGEDGDKVVFGSAEVAFGKVGAVIVGGGTYWTGRCWLAKNWRREREVSLSRISWGRGWSRSRKKARTEVKAVIYDGGVLLGRGV